jgi:hypothetical protein
MVGRRLPLPGGSRGARFSFLLGGLVVSAAGCSLVTSWAGYVGDDDGGAGTDAGTETDGQGGDAAGGDSASADAQAMDVAPSDGADEEGNPGDAAQDSGNPGGDGGTDAPVAPITCVQVTAATPSAAVSTVSATFTQAQSAGDLIVLVVGWGGNASVTQVSDSAGNGYAASIAPTHISAGITQAIYYAKGIAAASAGGNTVTVTLGAPTTPLDLRAVEYAGLDPVAPYDTSAAFGGRSTTASSGAVTTTSARELVFGAGITVGSFTGVGAAFTLRKLTAGGLGVVEDRVVSSTGSYSADAPLASSASYIMQVATFR